MPRALALLTALALTTTVASPAVAATPAPVGSTSGTLAPIDDSGQVFITGETSARPGATVTVKLPVGVGVSSRAAFFDGEGDSAELKVTPRGGRTVAVTLPARAAAGDGGLLLEVSRTTVWPDWDVQQAVGIDVTVSAKGEAAPTVQTTASAFMTVAPVAPRPGEPLTLTLPTGDVLLDQLRGITLTGAKAFLGPLLSERKSIMLEDDRLGTTVADDGRSLTLTPPSSYPIDSYPANEDAPYLVIKGTGTGDISTVAFYSEITFERAQGDRVGLARPTSSGALSFLLPAQTNDDGGKTTTLTFGRRGDLPLMADWDGDGKPSPGVYRPSTGTFYLQEGSKVTAVRFGPTGGTPLAGRFTAGSDRATIGVYRDGTFYLAGANTSGGGKVTTVKWGRGTDQPVVGNWNGESDGVARVGLFRASERRFYLSGSNVTGGKDVRKVSFGVPGDHALAGDWDGDGTTDVGVRYADNFRLATDLKAKQVPSTVLRMGRSTDQPFAYAP